MVDQSQLQNAFEFVAMASARARQLLQGCRSKIQTAEAPVRAAQREIVIGAVQKVEGVTAGAQVSRGH